MADEDRRAVYRTQRRMCIFGFTVTLFAAGVVTYMVAAGRVPPGFIACSILLLGAVALYVVAFRWYGRRL